MPTSEFPNLPKNWQIKELGEVCELCNGYAFKSSSFINKGVPVIRIGNIKNFEIDISNAMQVQISQDYENYQIQNGDLLIAMSGATTGKMGIYKLQNPAYLNQRVGNLKIKSNEIIPEYRNFALYALQTEIYKRAYGGAQPNISKGAIESLKIPLPPLEIQKRIVARLESAFEKIEKGSAHLQDAKTKLAKYKQSLLKSAFNGTLFCHTEGEARSISNQESRDISLTLNMTNSPSLRANEASVANQNNDTTKAIDCHSPNGLRNDSTHSSLRESAADETIHKVDCHDLTSSKLAMTDKENPKLPQGWTIKTLGEIGEIISGGTPSTKQVDNFGGDIAWITPADLSNHNDKFISQGKRNISEKGLKNSSARLVPKGTILFSSRAPIGYVAIASNQLCTNQGFKNLIPSKNVSSEFVYYYLLNSKNLAESYASGTTFKEISAKSFSKLPIPLPPLETQKQIVKLLEKHLQHADKTGKFIESALNKAKQLKQSLLKSAFLGKLT